MDAIILGIAINILAYPLIFLIGVSYQKKIQPFLLRFLLSIRAFLPFSINNNDLIVLTYGYVKPMNRNHQFSVEQGDLMALLKAYEFAAKLRSPEKIKIQDSCSLFKSKSLHKNILSISGPKWNKISEYYLGSLGSPIFFIRNPKGLAVFTPSMNKPEIFRTQRISKKIANTCYGLIICSQNVTIGAERQNIVLCAGCTTLSTNAALLYLKILTSFPKRLNEINKQGGLSKNRWAILLKVKNINHLKESIDSPLTEEDVDISVVKVFQSNDFLKPYRISYEKNNEPDTIIKILGEE